MLKCIRENTGEEKPVFLCMSGSVIEYNSFTLFFGSLILFKHVTTEGRIFYVTTFCTVFLRRSTYSYIYKNVFGNFHVFPLISAGPQIGAAL